MNNQLLLSLIGHIPPAEVEVDYLRHAKSSIEIRDSTETGSKKLGRVKEKG
ncbi:hypothetical protein [Erythrobacter sp. QSSC1-22B]|uniref:hypothetical protein n=1 Tax=Erythrobacter sp. QSSC1-22B TaxID=1860125 RepID=UPI00143BC4BC|nr:hypothetical protein [Erythrobacter sp. QSSC1-22B]